MGSPEFALPSFQAITKSHHKIIGVVTQPDRPKGRGQILQPTSIKKVAQENQISPIFQPQKLLDYTFIDDLKSLTPDLFVVVAFRILPEEVFSIPPKGTINLHPSLLPKYRGAAPIHWTIINGEKETGATIIQITRKIDSGGIILQKKMPIYDDDTAGSLHDRLSSFGADLLIEAINAIDQGDIFIRKQDDNLATPAPKIDKDTCHISFKQSADKVKNWIHGLSPFPTAYAILNNKNINLFKAKVVDINPIIQEPGRIINIDNGKIHVACQPGVISILELQREGRKRLSSSEFLRGYRLKIGDVFI